MAGAAASASTLPFQLRRRSAAWWRRLAWGLGGGVVDGVGEALGDDVVEVGVDVGLEGEHVGGGEVVRWEAEDLPDALVAVGCAPVEGDGEGVVVGGDAGVGCGEDAVGWIEGLGELVEGDVAGPVLGGVEGVDGDGADGTGLDEAAAEGDFADGVVADVALVVGVDDVLGGAAEGGEGGEEAGPVGGGVDVEEGGGDVGWGRRWSSGGRGLRCSEGRMPEMMGVVMLPCWVVGTSRMTSLLPRTWMISCLMEDGVPGAVGGFVFGGVAGAAGVLDVDVLHVGAEVGEAPGDVVVVADDDEGDAGKGDAGDVEVPVGGGFEVGLVPDAGDAVGEVHVVREERLAGGGVGAGDDPVVGAGDAVFAEGSFRDCSRARRSWGSGGWWLDEDAVRALRECALMR